MSGPRSLKEALGTPAAGDINCCVNLFFNNSGTVLAVIQTLIFVLPKGHEDLVNEIIYQKILAGMVVTITFGNCYYGWMATRLMRRESRYDATALPYGINTPAAFAFIFDFPQDSFSQLLQK